MIGTIARSLGLFDGEGDLDQRLVAHIDDRRLLLVVDNFEQVVDAAPSLAAIVASSPSLKVAVTSRTRLRVSGEQEFPLEPLARDAAVSLFVERARAVRPDFEPDVADLDMIAEICGHVDDLPLAIELAATRIKVLSPAAMLARLERRLELLTRGRGMRPPGIGRCATRSAGASSSSTTTRGRSSAAWPSSSAAARSRRSRRCATETSTASARSSTRASCAPTASASPCSRRSTSTRASCSTQAPRRRTSGVLTPRTTSVSSRRHGAGRSTRRLAATLEAEHDNLRAALRFSLDTGDAATALQLCAFLWRFWFERGYLSEGRLWLDGVARRFSRGVAGPRPRAERQRRPRPLPGRLRPCRGALPGSTRALSLARRLQGRRGGVYRTRAGAGGRAETRRRRRRSFERPSPSTRRSATRWGSRGRSTGWR